MTQEEFKRSVDDDVRGLIRRGEEKAIAHQPSVIEVIQALAVDERVNVEKLAALMGLQDSD